MLRNGRKAKQRKEKKRKEKKRKEKKRKERKASDQMRSPCDTDSTAIHVGTPESRPICDFLC